MDKVAVLGMPADLDAERFLISCCMSQESLVDELLASVQPNDFSLEKHRRIFTAVRDLRRDGSNPDRIAVARRLMDLGQLESCDGIGYLVAMDEGLSGIISPASSLDIVREMSRRRRIIDACHRGIEKTIHGGASAAVITEINSELAGASVRAGESGFQSTEQIVSEAGLSRLLGPARTGLLTGISDLDEMTLGIHEGELIIIAARPAMGKTALMLSIASNMTRKYKKRGAILSLEMSKESLLKRLVGIEAHVDLQKMRMGTLTDAERARAQAAALDLAQRPLYINDDPVSDLHTMLSNLRKLEAESGALDFIMIDYLQLMNSTRYSGNRVAEVSEISRGLKLAAKEIAPVVALSQLTRDPEKRKGEDKRPQLSDLRESGSIEQDADGVWSVFREEVYEKDRDDLKGKAEIGVLKQRSGPIGTARAVYIKEYTAFMSPISDDQKVWEQGFGNE